MNMTPELPSWSILQLVMPELWLGIAMCAVILVPFIRRESHVLPTVTAVIGLVLALISTLATIRTGSDHFGVIFGGMLAVDHFSQFFKLILLVFTMLVIVQWLILDRESVSIGDLPDFLCLLLGAALGMSLMASAQHLVMFFVAIEAASLPSYALAGYRKKHRLGAESSLKYVVFGSASSAIMLYGMSLIYGATGALDIHMIAHQAASQGVSPLLAMGLTAMLAGLAFKLSAVPLHFWCPDVFQAAPTQVTTFLSVASKGAAIMLLCRFLGAFGSTSLTGNTMVGLAAGLGILGAVTATWGNLVALHQNNVKRLLAYSSIAHAGYMIMAVSVLAIARAGNPSFDVAGAVLFYILIYTFMNLGAFTVAGLMAQQTGSEDIRDYAGLGKRNAVLAILMTVFLLSLFGMPGLGGFIGKMLLMKVMAEAGFGGFVLIAVLLVNTVISLYYYLRPVYFMYLVPDTQDRPRVSLQGSAYAVLGLCAVMLLWTGLFANYSTNLTREYGVMTGESGASAMIERHESQAAMPEQAAESDS